MQWLAETMYHERCGHCEAALSRHAPRLMCSGIGAWSARAGKMVVAWAMPEARAAAAAKLPRAVSQAALPKMAGASVASASAPVSG